jgi:hypothetical protein
MDTHQAGAPERIVIDAARSPVEYVRADLYQGAVDLLRRVLAVSDPLPPDGVDVQVEAVRFLDGLGDAG